MQIRRLFGNVELSEQLTKELSIVFCSKYVDQFVNSMQAAMEHALRGEEVLTLLLSIQILDHLDDQIEMNSFVRSYPLVRPTLTKADISSYTESLSRRTDTDFCGSVHSISWSAICSGATIVPLSLRSS